MTRSSQPRARRTRRIALRARRGFTIAELIVAILIITVGVVALAGSSAAVLRQMDLAQGQTLAATIAQSEFETIRSYGACASMTSGSSTIRHMPVAWTVSTVPGTTYNARYVKVVVKFQYRTSTKTYTVGSVVPCT